MPAACQRYEADYLLGGQGYMEVGSGGLDLIRGLLVFAKAIFGSFSVVLRILQLSHRL